MVPTPEQNIHPSHLADLLEDPTLILTSIFEASGPISLQKSKSYGEKGVPRSSHKLGSCFISFLVKIIYHAINSNL